MTLNVQFSWTDYVTDGVQTVFAYPFFLKDPHDLVAYWNNLLLPSGFYTLTGVGLESGGNLITTTPLAPGRLVLKRGTPHNQLTDYLEGDAFPAESHEVALDRLTLLVQDIYEVLSRSSMLKVTIPTTWRGLVLPDPIGNTVLGWDSAGLQWTLYPSGVTQIAVDPVSGIGWGKNTVEITPVAGSLQASGLVFPAGVLAVAVSAWVETTLGTTQGLQQVGLGTTDLPDCWGLLPSLSAASETTAGIFQGYSGQPQPEGGLVTLTAYGGRFDGTGGCYVTGHFMTFRPTQTVGYSFHPGTPDEGAPLPMEYATTTHAGIVELATPAEHLDGLRGDLACTPEGLAAALADLTGALPASETVAGILQVATTAETSTGVIDTDAVSPLKLKQQLDPMRTDTTALQTTTGTHTSQIAALQSTDATHTSQITALQTKVPNGTALSLVRYASGGAVLESTPGLITLAGGNLGIGVTPGAAQALAVRGNSAQIRDDGGTLSVNMTVYGAAAANGVNVAGFRARGTEALPQPVQSSDSFLRLVGKGYDGSAFPTSARTWIDLAAAELWTGTAQGSQIIFNTTLTGGTSQGTRLTIDGSGNLTTWGGLCGLGTPLTATLGSGASYQALSVKGSTLYVGQSSLQERPVAAVLATMPVSSDATRTGRMTLSAYDATAAREGVRVEADGTAGRLSFFGGTAVVKPAVTGAKGGNAALTSLLTALSGLGLVTDSST